MGHLELGGRHRHPLGQRWAWRTRTPDVERSSAARRPRARTSAASRAISDQLVGVGEAGGGGDSAPGRSAAATHALRQLAQSRRPGRRRTRKAGRPCPGTPRAAARSWASRRWPSGAACPRCRCRSSAVTMALLAAIQSSTSSSGMSSAPIRAARAVVPGEGSQAYSCDGHCPSTTSSASRPSTFLTALDRVGGALVGRDTAEQQVDEGTGGRPSAARLPPRWDLRIDRPVVAVGHDEHAILAMEHPPHVVHRPREVHEERRCSPSGRTAAGPAGPSSRASGCGGKGCEPSR